MKRGKIREWGMGSGEWGVGSGELGNWEMKLRIRTIIFYTQ
jgi:hypothetical protein